MGNVAQLTKLLCDASWEGRWSPLDETNIRPLAECTALVLDAAGVCVDRSEALANLLAAVRDTANWMQSSCCSGYAMQRSAKLKTLLAEYEALA